ASGNGSQSPRCSLGQAFFSLSPLKSKSFAGPGNAAHSPFFAIAAIPPCTRVWRRAWPIDRFEASGAASAGDLGDDQLEALEIVAIETRVAGDQAVALQQRVGADQEVGHRAHSFAAALAVATLHFAGA